MRTSHSDDESKWKWKTWKSLVRCQMGTTRSMGTCPTPPVTIQINHHFLLPLPTQTIAHVIPSPIPR
jgi:hypothetical protein